MSGIRAANRRSLVHGFIEIHFGTIEAREKHKPFIPNLYQFFHHLRATAAPTFIDRHIKRDE
jgi:hypothetical protein